MINILKMIFPDDSYPDIGGIAFDRYEKHLHLLTADIPKLNSVLTRAVCIGTYNAETFYFRSGDKAFTDDTGKCFVYNSDSDSWIEFRQDFISSEIFAEKMDTQNQFLAALVEAQGGTLKPTSWANVQALVRAGLHSKVFSIGDQLVCKKGNNDLIWDIIGIDRDTLADSQFTHSMTLQLHDCLANTMQFDANEALYYAESGLAAGTYNFTIQSGYDTAHGGGKSYQFTLENAVPVGGQLTFGWTNNAQAANAKVSSFASSTSTTAIETVSVTEGSAGTSLGTTDGNSTNLNLIHRARFGSNNYAQSAIRQYLNSDKSAGNVWTPQTVFDRPPAWAADTAGFMSDLDSDFLAVIGKSHKITALNPVTDGGGSAALDDKFFLLSRSEVYGGLENNVNEGSPYPYYSDYSDLSEAGIGNDTNRIKYVSNTAQWWWLRTPDFNSAHFVRYISASGNANVTNSFGIGGVAPACNII